MKLFDLHQDLMLHMLAREKYGQNEQTSWTLLESSVVDLVVATAFPDPISGDQADPIVNMLITEDIQRYRKFLDNNTHAWKLVEKTPDLDVTTKKLILHIEGINAVSDSTTLLVALSQWVAMGVRSIAPWWNIDNALGGGTHSPTRGLTPLGRLAIEWIETNGLLLDLAHASRQTFLDVAQITKRPLYVSHGNADTLCPTPRNYTDEQLRLIAETDGVIGVFFPATFTVGAGIPGTIFDAVRHIVYIRDLIGVRHVAIGSDFGGIISGTLQGLSSVTDLPALTDALRFAGFTTDDIEAIFYTNALRVIRTHIQ